MSIGGHSSRQLGPSQRAVAVPITRLESLVHAEVWSVAEALAEHLSLFFSREVRTEGFEEELASFRHEEVRATVSVLSMVRWSSFDLTFCILIVWIEGVTELVVGDATIAISIIASDKEVHFIFMWNEPISPRT